MNYEFNDKNLKLIIEMIGENVKEKIAKEIEEKNKKLLDNLIEAIGNMK